MPSPRPQSQRSLGHLASPAPKGGSVSAAARHTALPNPEPIRAAEFKVLRLIEAHPTLSQRDMAEALGLSLGKANYCIRALIDRGWIAACGTRATGKLVTDRYVLTRAGHAARQSAARAYLAQKRAEFGALQAEIAELEQELAGAVPTPR